MKPGNKIIIKTLDKDWCDNDEIMLHACFELMVDCIENEKLFENFDWKHSEKSKKEKVELKLLHSWWKKRLNKKSFTEKDYKEENAMLIRLIKIRSRLWT